MKKVLTLVILAVLAMSAVVFTVGCGSENEIAMGEFNVNGIRVAAPASFVHESEFVGPLMMPLVPIAEALGFEVNINEQTGEILIGNSFALNFNSEEIYITGFGRPLFISAPPEIVNGIVFVSHDVFILMGHNVRTHVGNDLRIVEIKSYSDSMFEWLTLRVAMATEEHMRNYESYIEFIEFEDDGNLKIVIVPSSPVTDFRWIEIGYNFDDEDEFYIYGTEIYYVGEVTPEQPFVVTWIPWGTMPHRGVSFVDGHGETRYFSLNTNNIGYPESLHDMYLFVEFFQ